MSHPEIITAVPTAFTAEGELDVVGTRAILRHVRASGTDGALILGTTGEFPAIDDDEYRRIVQLALEELGEVTRVIVHAGQPSTRQAIGRAGMAIGLGATELAALPPYYLPVTDEELEHYFTALSDTIGGDASLFAYDFPARTGNRLSPALLHRVARLPNVVGAKFSGLTLDEVDAHIRSTPPPFAVYTGSDRELAQITAIRGAGVVSGVASALPRPFLALRSAMASGDSAAAASAQRAVDEVVDAIGGDLGRLKFALETQGIAVGHCRMSVPLPTGGTAELIRAVVERYA